VGTTLLSAASFANLHLTVHQNSQAKFLLILHRVMLQSCNI